VRYRPVAPELLARLRAEEADETVPKHALRAVGELLQAPGRPDLKAVLGFALEVREYLLIEQRSDLLVELARLVRRALAETPEAATAFLESWLDARTLRALASTLRPDEVEVPPHLAELLDAASGAALDHLIDLLTAEGEGPRAPLLRRLVVRGCRHAPQTIAARLHGASGARRWCCSGCSPRWTRRRRFTRRSRPPRRRTRRCSARPCDTRGGRLQPEIARGCTIS